MARSLQILILLASVVASVPTSGNADEPETKQESPEWTPLFDGKSLEGWKPTKFGGEGDVYVENDAIIMEFGSPMTGITCTDTIPTDQYEIRLEAKRMDGTDFFCGLTFPVKDKHLTLVVGGWGGALVGLSSIDGDDASENDTRRTIPFKRNRWYPVRVRVLDNTVTVWIDGAEVIKKPLQGHQLSLRPEVNLSRPLGISAWETRAALRKLAIRSIDDRD